MEEKYKNAYKRVELPKEKTSYFHLNCPSCNSGIPSVDMNINDKLAKCSSCDAVFSFEEYLLHIGPDPEPLKKPVNVEKMYINDELEISIPEPMRVINTIILSLFPFLILLSVLIYYKKDAQFAAYIGGFLSLGLIYAIIQQIGWKRQKIYFNTSRKHVKIDWISNSLKKTLIVPSHEIEQIYTTRTHTGVALKAVLNTIDGQKHKVLVEGIKSVMIAKYVEQEIENHLKIEPKKVSNEIE